MPLVAVTASLALAVASPAPAAAPCDQRVLLDWYEDGRVDRTYQLHCYEDAVQSLPTDLRDYTDAEEVIQRALQSALRRGGTVERGAGAASASSRPSALVPALGAAALAALAGGGLWYARRARSARADGGGPG